MSNESHVQQMTLTPAGMREPKLSEGTMFTRMHIMPEILRDNIAASNMLMRNGYKLSRALAEGEYRYLINGLVIPNERFNRWDGFQESELRQLQASLIYAPLPYNYQEMQEELGKALAARRG